MSTSFECFHSDKRAFNSDRVKKYLPHHTNIPIPVYFLEIIVKGCASDRAVSCARVLFIHSTQLL